MRTPLGTNVEITHDELAGRYAVLEDGVRIGTLTKVYVRTSRGRRNAWVIADAGIGVDREQLPDGYTFDPGIAVENLLAVRAAAERSTRPDGLTERERTLLDFEIAHAFASYEERVHRAFTRFGLPEWRYLQILNEWINAGPDSPQWRYAPDHLARLAAQRDQRLRTGPGAARRLAAHRAAVSG